ncbi:MAG: hypothetical protein ACR2NP_06085 [Pirellulaceae bacterium]
MRIPFQLRVTLLVILSTLLGVVASASAQTNPNSQVNSGWRDGRSLAPPVVYTASAVPYASGQAISPGYAVAPVVAFDPYATQTAQAGSFVHANALPAPVYQAQAPAYQVAPVPQQLPQVAPVYVPQTNLVQPGMSPYPGWGGVTPYGFNSAGNLWTVQLNALYMKRGKPGSFPLLVNGGGMTLVNADQLEFDYEWGFDVGISRRINNNQNIELKYFQIRDMTSTFSSPFVAGDALATSPPTPLFVGPAGATIDYLYNSSLNNFEINWITRTAAPRFRVGLGFRWIEVSDNLLQTLTGPGPMVSTMLTDTNNHLYGLQIMGDMALFNSGKFAMVPWIKAGIFGNFSDQDTTFTSPAIFSTASGTNASFVGETGLLGEFQLGPRVSLVGGYQFLYMTGITLAADQLPNMGPGLGGFVPITLDQSDILYHGAIFGIDIHW